MEKLTWREVFNTTVSFKMWHDIDKAMMYAHNGGYEYFTWNGDVYVIESSKCKCTKTDYTVDMLNSQIDTN